MPQEVRKQVAAVSGKLQLGDESYDIVRPLNSSPSARIDVAGAAENLRLPFATPQPGSPITYLRWLLSTLDLPRLDVPSAPTRPESDPTPISINDYLLYCTMPQDELGFALFGSGDPFKNIKRQYVFKILYGLLNVEMATLQEELRKVLLQLRELQSQEALFARFLEGTPLENRAAIERRLDESRDQLKRVESRQVKLADQVRGDPAVVDLQQRVQQMQDTMSRKTHEVAAERASIGDLRALAAQLETQIGRLTRAIVAGKHLTDIDFLMCPRCGHRVDRTRASEAECYLCLQQPTNVVPREALLEEQARLEAQLFETRDLVTSREGRITNLERDLAGLREELRAGIAELNHRTRTFVSGEADQLVGDAERRRP